MSGELPEERWLPTQTVNTIILSLISLLDEPNFSSPANVDASVQLRKDKKGYKKKIEQLIKKAKKNDIPKDLKIPHPDTDPEERAKAVEKIKLLNAPVDFFDDDDFNDENDFMFDEDDNDEFMDGEDEDFDDDEDCDE